ncbi:hypothetical protein CPC08DRAFT_770842 [Agrocybe pediades]|nr:hypothetical protein CPC08DRAFT_770842 [Agrocybe pediades]
MSSSPLLSSPLLSSPLLALPPRLTPILARLLILRAPSLLLLALPQVGAASPPPFLPSLRSPTSPPRLPLRSPLRSDHRFAVRSLPCAASPPRLMVLTTCAHVCISRSTHPSGVDQLALLSSPLPSSSSTPSSSHLVLLIPALGFPPLLTAPSSTSSMPSPCLRSPSHASPPASIVDPLVWKSRWLVVMMVMGRAGGGR